MLSTFNATAFSGPTSRIYFGEYIGLVTLWCAALRNKSIFSVMYQLVVLTLLDTI